MNVYMALHDNILGKRGKINVVKDEGIILGNGIGVKHISGIDQRDKRTLIIFDGFFVAGSLPRGSKIIDREVVEHLSIRKDNFREPIDYTVRPTYSRFGDTNTVEVVLRRWFVLLPTCRTVVFRYRPKSLSPQGVIIDVKDGKAQFSTTSY